jgi:flagellar biosynthesis GTPase FlhF
VTQGTGTEQHRHHTVEVAVFNLFSILWEMEVGEPYNLTRKNDIFSGLGERDGGRQTQSQSQAQERTDEQKKASEVEEEEFVRVEELLDSIEEETETEAEAEEVEDKKLSASAATVSKQDSGEKERKEKQQEEELLAQELKRAECIVETFRDIKVTSLPPPPPPPLTLLCSLSSLSQVLPLVGSPSEALKKAHYSGLFDGIFVSSRAAQFIQTPLADSILHSSPCGLVGVETCKYIPLLNRDKKAEFVAKETEFGESHGWTLLRTGFSLLSSSFSLS